jgi:hypothetical protein
MHSSQKNTPETKRKDFGKIKHKKHACWAKYNGEKRHLGKIQWSDNVKVLAKYIRDLRQNTLRKNSWQITMEKSIWGKIQWRKSVGFGRKQRKNALWAKYKNIWAEYMGEKTFGAKYNEKGVKVSAKYIRQYSKNCNFQLF